MPKLRPYQNDNLADVWRLFNGEKCRAVLSVLPTGAGKTVTFAEFVRQVDPEPALIVAHRIELIRQASAKLTAAGVPHGIIAPGYPATNHRVQVGSIQTLIRRLGVLRVFAWIILDEAHHALAASWRRLLAAQPAARVLGYTATPQLMSGQGLGAISGGVFDGMAVGPSVADMVADGYLVRTRVWAPPVSPDLTEVRIMAGEFHPGDLSVAMDRAKLTGDAAEHYELRTPGGPSITFATSVEHAMHLEAAFRAEGWRFRAVFGATEEQERAAAMAGLGTGGLHGLVSCSLVDEGLDIPSVSVVIDTAPTQSLPRYLQRAGRAGRPVYAPGFDLETRDGRLAAIAASSKPYATILDHAGNVMRHGMPDSVREWSLAGAKRRGAVVPATAQCPDCYALHKPAALCPACGHDYRVAERAKREAIRVVSGELAEMLADDIRLKSAPLAELMRGADRAGLEKIAKARGYSPRWVDIQMGFRGRPHRPSANDASEFAA